MSISGTYVATNASGVSGSWSANWDQDEDGFITDGTLNPGGLQLAGSTCEDFPVDPDSPAFALGSATLIPTGDDTWDIDESGTWTYPSLGYFGTWSGEGTLIGSELSPTITSVRAATFSEGSNDSFAFSATGEPGPSVSISGNLPSGVTFDDGDATLTGKPSPGSAGTYHLTVTASNDAGEVEQSFTLVVLGANSANAPASGTAEGSGDAAQQSTSCTEADPVDCASGDFWQTFTDASVPGRGPGLNLTRTYNSLSASTQGMFGYGWTSDYGDDLTTNSDGSITVTEDDGSQVTAEPNGSGGFTVPSWADSTLTANANGTYTFVRHATQIFRFSSSGQLTAISDLNGYTTTLAYNSDGQLTTVTDSAGRTLRFTYGSNGLVSSVTDPIGRQTSYDYDGNSNLTSVTDPLGRVTSFTYDGGHLLLAMTDPRGGVVTNTYDGSGRVLTQSDPMGRVTTFAYSGNNFSLSGGTTTITDPLGNVELEQYVNGCVVETTKAYGTPLQATWTYGYDPVSFGMTSETDPNGNTTTHTYDANGNLLTSTDPLGRTTTYTYNDLNEVLTKTTPLEEVTTNTYDSDGNLISTTDPAGGTTTYAYGDSYPGDVTSVADPAGRVTTYTYDDDGDQVSESTVPSGGVTDTTGSSYDADGEKVCTALPNATASGVSCPTAGDPRVADTTTTTYDADGEPTTVTDPVGDEARYSYDGDGNKVQVIDPASNTTSYSYDADNELASTTQANGATTRSTYDADGNVLTTADADGHVTTYTYDALNRKVTSTNPLGEQTSYAFDLDGNLLTTTDPSGRVTSKSYDADNELTGTLYSDGVTPDVSYAYNADGERTSMVDGTGTTTYTYDADQRLTSSTDGAGEIVSYGYDPDGNVTTLTYPNGDHVTNTYNGAGEQIAQTDWLDHTSTFSYDHDGNVTSEILGSVVDTTSFNGDDQIISIADTLPAKKPKVIFGFTYTRSADSLVASAGPLGKPAKSYSYNTMDQVTKDQSGAYAYDPAGNLTTDLKTTPLQYNDGDELLSAGKTKKATAYSFDAEGNRTGSTPAKGAASSYSYNQAQELTGYVQSQTSASYAYNGDGIRTSKTVNGTSTPYTWNLVTSTPLLLSDGSTSYLYGPNGLPVESISNTGTVAYYHHDQLGSTTLLTSSAGSKLVTYTYNSYGLIAKQKGSSTNPMLFAGQYRDLESGLYYLHARYYDPSTAQFMSVDPNVSVTGQPYSYAGDNPVNETDPSGRTWLSISVAAGKALYGTYSVVNGTALVIAGTVADTTIVGSVFGVPAQGAGVIMIAGGLRNIWQAGQTFKQAEYQYAQSNDTCSPSVPDTPFHSNLD